MHSETSFFLNVLVSDDSQGAATVYSVAKVFRVVISMLLCGYNHLQK